MRRFIKRLITSLFILLILALLAIVYLFKWAPRPAVYIDDETGLTIFGYDRIQNRWLMNEYQHHELGIDGPHIFYGANGSREAIYVRGDTALQLVREPLQTGANGSLICTVDNADRSRFSFHLKDSLPINPSSYPQPKKLLAISDIEGNFRAFIRLLMANGVVDSIRDGGLHWTYGDGHLVLVGDFMDRGINVTQCLWLIYKLEQEAQLSGGHVHFILGNHEQLNLQGVVRYVDPKYRELTRQLGIQYKDLFGPNTELGRWLRSKNVIERIGSTLYLHGGIAPQISRLANTPEVINDLCRNQVDKKEEDIADARSRELLGARGILWYRGLVDDYRGEQKRSTAAVDSIVNAFDVRRMVVGHSLVDAVSTDHQGKVIRLDVLHTEREPQALLIENGGLFRVGVNGLRTVLGVEE